MSHVRKSCRCRFVDNAQYFQAGKLPSLLRNTSAAFVKIRRHRNHSLPENAKLQ